MSRVAILGCGVVGPSRAPVFLRAGFEIVLFDAAPAARENAAAVVRSALAPRAGSATLIGAVEAERRRVTPAKRLAARRLWRDRCLAAVVTEKQRGLAEVSATSSEKDA